MALAALLLSAGAKAQSNETPSANAPVPTTAPAPAPDQQKPSPAEPRVHHAPASVAPAHEALAVRADIEHPELVAHVLLLFRTPDSSGWREIEFQRASDGPYVAIVPEGDVKWPSLSYVIEMEKTDGKRVAAFASRANPFTVQIPEDLMDVRERALDQRLGGRRSVFSTTGEYVSFGSSKANVSTAGAQESVNDRYYRIEAAYTYRPLRVVTEFSVRAGVVRGKAPVPLRDPIPGQSESERFDVGLNYGAPTVRFRLHDAVHLEGELLTSVTEVGFSWGGGGALLIGDPYGSKLTLGFESIQTFGTRFWSRMDVRANDRFVIAPIVEITNMPSAEDYGVRLLGEAQLEVGSGFAVAARGGYQARLATSGGPAFGATLSYAF
ncbi:MAG: hypothetical protein KC776_16360 [Myxococcales bacterium]|nr:hypothetical protein [Myxococcales bacterium]